MFGFQYFAVGLHREKVRVAEDTFVATIRAMITYIALFHSILVVKIRISKMQIDILVDILDITTASVIMSSKFNPREICSGDK